jgi:hypothetical protein
MEERERKMNSNAFQEYVNNGHIIPLEDKK